MNSLSKNFITGKSHRRGQRRAVGHTLLINSAFSLKRRGENVKGKINFKYLPPPDNNPDNPAATSS